MNGPSENGDADGFADQDGSPHDALNNGDFHDDDEGVEGYEPEDVDAEYCRSKLIDLNNSCLTDGAMDAMTQLFTRFDVDNDSALSRAEMGALLRETNGEEDPASLDWIFSTYSLDAKGNLEMDGFLDLYFQRAYNYPAAVFHELVNFGYGNHFMDLNDLNAMAGMDPSPLPQQPPSPAQGQGSSPHPPSSMSPIHGIVPSASSSTSQISPTTTTSTTLVSSPLLSQVSVSVTHDASQHPNSGSGGGGGSSNNSNNTHGYHPHPHHMMGGRGGMNGANGASSVDSEFAGLQAKLLNGLSGTYGQHQQHQHQHQHADSGHSPAQQPFSLTSSETKVPTVSLTAPQLTVSSTLSPSSAVSTPAMTPSHDVSPSAGTLTRPSVQSHNSSSTLSVSTGGTASMQPLSSPVGQFSPSSGTRYRIRPLSFALNYHAKQIALRYQLISQHNDVVDEKVRVFDVSWLEKETDVTLACGRLFRDYPAYLDKVSVSMKQLKRLLLRLQDNMSRDTRA